MMPPQRTILIFLKFPEPGRVKSRLGRTIGFEEAAMIYRQLVTKVTSIVSKSPADQIQVLFDPPHAETAIREWLGPVATGWHFSPQSSGDLGARLNQGFSEAFDDGATSVAAIGTDCVEITTSSFEYCWQSLSSPTPQAVFGPTYDGGYYLIGLNRSSSAVFQDIPWSTEKTLSESIAAAEQAGFEVTQLQRLSDIDEESDLIDAQERGVI